MTKKDLTGQKFGRLVVLEEAGKDKHRAILWKCQCQCEKGSIVIIYGNSLRKGKTKSCGCFNKEKLKETHTKHGHTKNGKETPVYIIWQNMLARCYGPSNKDYHNYGGRGIKICNRWLGKHGFENFYEDIGKYRPEGKTLERINNDGHYKPENCTWITKQEQQWNTTAKGYYWHAQNQKWQAQIVVNKKYIYLGCFDIPEEARQTYIEAKWKYHGVWLNE